MAHISSARCHRVEVWKLALGLTVEVLALQAVRNALGQGKEAGNLRTKSERGPCLSLQAIFLLALYAGPNRSTFHGRPSECA